jgi:hypothetical protein
MQCVIWVCVFAVIAVELAIGKANALTIFPIVALCLLSASMGFGVGIWQEHRLLEKSLDETAPCIGGPMDGHSIPVPSGWHDAQLTVGVAGFPEGVYLREDDHLVWEEQD